MRGMRDLEAAVSYGTPLKPYQLKEVLRQVSQNLPGMKFNVSVNGQVLADEALISVIENIAKNAKSPIIPTSLSIVKGVLLETKNLDVHVSFELAVIGLYLL